jgi:cyclic pyranopterin monophosphate synthase
MLDISKKSHSLRTAIAKARIMVQPATLERIRKNEIPKGNPFEVAKVAAIQAAKRTDTIIPYCHPLPVDFVGVDFETGIDWIEVRTTVKAIYKTGVEMEALTAASVAALTLYDMLKMIDETMTIQNVALVEKKGGKSDFKTKYEKSLRAAVVVMSDSIAAGKKDDLSGKLIIERLKAEGVDATEYLVIPDEEGLIVKTLQGLADEKNMDLIITTGGTGFSKRDCTPEAMLKVIEREIPGIPETARAYGQSRTPFSMLSRGRAGIRNDTLIVNLPGSKKGVAESLDALFPALLHSFKMMHGGGHTP